MNPSSNRHLVILGCSSRKLTSNGVLPAIERYDGPTYHVLRSFLRRSAWPSRLSVAVLSARYGLIGGLAPIEYYDQRMDLTRAVELRGTVTDTLLRWSSDHAEMSLVVGRDYLHALDLGLLEAEGVQPAVVQGPIGMKLNWLSLFLSGMQTNCGRRALPEAIPERPLYFLPDWDDMLDVDYDFRRDEFSCPNKKERNEQHVVHVMQPRRICDGVLVSLAQQVNSKGILRKCAPDDPRSLAPKSVRQVFGMSADQWVFGDCGAFSYVGQDEPAITTEQAVSLYQLHGFDFGASVDHIPVQKIVTPSGKRTLSAAEQRRRVRLSKSNAEDFIKLHKRKKCSFLPVGIIQGLSDKDYGLQLPDYLDMGYHHVAIGGLVPRSDKEILDIVRAVNKSVPPGLFKPWIHLLGVFRPRIQGELRKNGVTSFDSATYFRKAWLRSGQNYLGADGIWYAAIRVPMTADGRTRNKLVDSRLPINEIVEMETRALRKLHGYGEGRVGLEDALNAVIVYDRLLNRNDENESGLDAAYRRTLEARPWERCNCPVCQDVGINVVIFRGYNRNKRRGAHNTLMLYRLLQCK